MKINYNDSYFFNNPTVGISSVDSAYVILTNATSFCSILSCLAMVTLYWLYRDIRTTSRKLLVCLSIANFWLGIAGILQAATYFKSLTLFDENDLLCQTASLLAVYSSICSYLWTDIIAFYLFLSVTLRSITIGNKLVVFFHVFCWVMPAIVALAAGAADVYGYDVNLVLMNKTPVWCWISDRVENQIEWLLMTIEGWAMSSLIFCFLAFTTLTISVHRQLKHQRAMDTSQVIEDMAIQTLNKQLRYIPAIFCILRLWGTLYFLVEKFDSRINQHYSTSGWLLIMKGICDNSQGLVNFILFCVTTKRIRNRISRWYRFHCLFGQKRSLDGSFTAPKIFRYRGKKKHRLDEMDLSGMNLDLPSASDQSAMMEDEVVFEQD